MTNHETFWTALGVGLASGFIAAIAVGALGNTSDIETPRDLAATPTSAEVDNQSDNHTPVTSAVLRVAPSVVSITTEQPPTRLFGYSEGASSDGSGVVIDSEGIILTNAHVVSAASRITVTFSDGAQTDARVIGLADDLDLAVLRIPVRPEMTAVTIGSSESLLLGEPVIAIGNPFGLGHTVTTGVVSATSRPLETDDRVFQDFIQTDASINPGNSGGPLLDRHGSLIGITTSIRPNAQGIGFAIPIDRAIKIARDLVEVGAVRLPWLGVALHDTRVRIDGRTRVAPGVFATLIEPTGPPALQTGDLITHADGRSIQGRSDLNAYLAGLNPGDTVRLRVFRSDQAIDIDVATSEPDPEALSRRTRARLGLVLEGSRLGQFLSLKSVHRGSAGWEIGLRPGDIILGIDGDRVSNTKDFYGAISTALARHRSTALITVRRGRAQGRVALPL